MKFIEDVINGVALIATGDKDYFEVVSAGLPNGDPSLRVRGDISQDYSAFVERSSLPTVIGSTTPSDISTSMWLKLSASTDLASPATTANSLMTVQSIDGILKASNQVTGSTQATGWRFCAGGIGGMDIEWSTSWKSGGGTKRVSWATRTLIPDQWHLVVVSQQASAINISIDADPYSGGATSTTTSADSTSNGDALAIGTYSEDPACGGRPGVWEIGKLAWHDHVLDDDERARLVASMMGA